VIHAHSAFLTDDGQEVARTPVHDEGGKSGFRPSCPEENFMIPVEVRLLEELRNCAVELRQLAYTLQNGIGEHDLLRLSERMRAAADEVVRSGV
jgi:hypothetical protein